MRVRHSQEDLLRGLNPEQATAVSFGTGPLLVLSGAGSGKTRVLTRRLAWLVAQGAAQESIVALTFTNKAAGEMKERVADLLASPQPRSFVGTFHSFGVRLLRRFADDAGLSRSFLIFDSDDQLSLIKQSLKKCGYDDKTMTPKGVQAKISSAKNAGLSLDSYPRIYGDFFGSRLVEVHRAYEKGLAASSALDFDDLLLRPLKLMNDRPDILERLQKSVQHLLVDEYQDTNKVQAILVKLLAGERRNVFAVGDEDQSIYRWRGAEVSNILEFARDFPGAKVVKLERNYRSTAPILGAAGAVVAENEQRLGKTLKAERSGGDKVRLVILEDDRTEAREVVSRIAMSKRQNPQGEIAVLYRANAQSRLFEDELLRNKIPYMIVGGIRFYERAEIKDALAYLRLLVNPNDDFSFRRVVNVPARGIGTTTLEVLTASAEEKGISLFRALKDLPAGLSERAKKALTEFRQLVTALAIETATGDCGAGDAVEAVLRKTGLQALYANSEDPQDISRHENLDQLLAASQEHEKMAKMMGDEADPGLAGFLDAVTLRSDADDADEKKGVLLMTVHAAKGLEFDSVFIVGMEEGFMPHISSRDDPEQLEEERRLAYVAMTRAKNNLTLSCARRRFFHGEWAKREESPFVDAIPPALLAVEDYTASRFNRSWTGFDSGEGTSGEALFPDYEGESQEVHTNVKPFGKQRAQPGRKVPVPAAVVPRMLKTPAPPSASGFRRGSMVTHPEYGKGVVLSVEGSGDTERLTIHFERAGRKKFLARFANLSPA